MPVMTDILRTVNDTYQASLLPVHLSERYLESGKANSVFANRQQIERLTRLPLQELPASMTVATKRKTSPHIIRFSWHHYLSDEFFKILKDFEVGELPSKEIEMLNSNGTLFGKYHAVQFVEFKDTLLAESAMLTEESAVDYPTYFRTKPEFSSGLESALTHRMIMSPSAAEGVDMWQERRLTQHLFFSDPLWDALTAAKVRCYADHYYPIKIKNPPSGERQKKAIPFVPHLFPNFSYLTKKVTPFIEPPVDANASPLEVVVLLTGMDDLSVSKLCTWIKNGPLRSSAEVDSSDPEKDLMKIDDVIVSVRTIKSEMQQDKMTALARNSVIWDAAADHLRGKAHAQQVVIAPLHPSTGPEAVQQAEAVQRVVAAICALRNVAAVSRTASKQFMKSSWTVLRPLASESMPLHLWIGMQIIKGGRWNELGVRTHGLSSFTGFEVQRDPYACRKDTRSIVMQLFFISGLLMKDELSLQNGDIIEGLPKGDLIVEEDISQGDIPLIRLSGVK